ncbi:MAG: hypothetical protein NC483_05535 [Ruminococcus sp.]|nr:hypothetical protein [Ruminococcus sp.]
MATFGMGDDDFRMVDANIDNLKLQPRYAKENEQDVNASNHCFLERKLNDGSIWVYDTSMGLVFDRDLYYLMENPQITKVNEKQAVLDYFEYQEIRNSNPDNDKYALPLILPSFELMAERPSIYRRALKKEIAAFKDRIHYDEICSEIEEDMRHKGFTEDDSEFLKMMRVLFKGDNNG